MSAYGPFRSSTSRTQMSANGCSALRVIPNRLNHRLQAFQLLTARIDPERNARVLVPDDFSNIMLSYASVLERGNC